MALECKREHVSPIVRVHAGSWCLSVFLCWPPLFWTTLQDHVIWHCIELVIHYHSLYVRLFVRVYVSHCILINALCFLKSVTPRHDVRVWCGVVCRACVAVLRVWGAAVRFCMHAVLNGNEAREADQPTLSWDSSISSNTHSQAASLRAGQALLRQKTHRQAPQILKGKSGSPSTSPSDF